MKASLRWLRDYAPLDAPVDTLVRALVETGTEVNRVEEAGAGVLVARVLSVEPIPEARTQVVFVDLDAGSRGLVRVISGAPNLGVGALVPWAPPGTLLPGRDQPLEDRAMFGGRYTSPGMLCSAAELGAGEDAEGILLLDRGDPGQPLREVLPLDVVLDLDVTTNRPDCLCHVGIARELAAALGETLQEPPATVPAAVESAASIRGRVEVRVLDTTGCRRFSVAIIEGVAVGDSPEWLQQRLRAVGLRPVNNVVDVTNFVAHELGQPLHAFDLERFAAAGDGAGTPTVVVRRGRGESLLGLDGVERIVGPEDVAVCSGDAPVSMAGVMGGAGTAVTSATTSVLLESATWDGPTIRASSRRLGRTDASTLFEKGLSDTLVPLALGRATALIADLGGGHALKGVVDEHPWPLPAPAPIAVSPDFLAGRLGYAVDSDEAATALARLGFTTEQGPEGLQVTPPHFRRDVGLPEDVVEEVGRSLGYARVPAVLPGLRQPATVLVPPLPAEDAVRDLLTGAGVDEVITYSFSAPATAALLPGLGEGSIPIPLRNPLSPEWSVMRISLLPGVCEALALNLNRGLSGVSVFELGCAFWEGRREGLAPGSTPDGEDLKLEPLPAEPALVALALHAPGDDPRSGAAVLRRAQAIVDEVVRELTRDTVRWAPATRIGLRPGRTAAAALDGGVEPLAIAGELAPETASALGLRGRVAVAELRLDAVNPAQLRAGGYRAPARFPAIVQDLSVVVPAAAAGGEALAAIREAGAPLLEDVELYDEYRDESLGAERKGWTFRLTYRAGDRTLTGEEANERHHAIERALVEGAGASVRR